MMLSSSTFAAGGGDQLDPDQAEEADADNSEDEVATEPRFQRSRSTSSNVSRALDALDEDTFKEQPFEEPQVM